MALKNMLLAGVAMMAVVGFSAGEAGAEELVKTEIVVDQALAEEFIYSGDGPVRDGCIAVDTLVSESFRYVESVPAAIEQAHAEGVTRIFSAPCIAAREFRYTDAPAPVGVKLPGGRG